MFGIFSPLSTLKAAFEVLKQGKYLYLPFSPSPLFLKILLFLAYLKGQADIEADRNLIHSFPTRAGAFHSKRLNSLYL